MLFVFSLVLSQNAFMIPFNDYPGRGIPIPVIKTLFIALLASTFTVCQPATNTNVATPTPEPPKAPAVYRYRIVNFFPHDPKAFTQGLLFVDGKLIESTGQEGRSSLRRVELQSGNILKKVEIPLPYFAEGIALLNGKLYQLTWIHKLGFIYDAQT
jgi:glutamine cyclotransferase